MGSYMLKLFLSTQLKCETPNELWRSCLEQRADVVFPLSLECWRIQNKSEYQMLNQVVHAKGHPSVRPSYQWG